MVSPLEYAEGARDQKTTQLLNIEQRMKQRFGDIGVRPLGAVKPALAIEWRSSCIGPAFVTQLNGVEIARQAGALNDRWSDAVFLVQQKVGTAFCREDGMEFRAGPGEIVIVDPCLDSSIKSEGPCKFLSFGIPRDTILSLEKRGLKPFHKVIRADTDIARILVGTIDLLLKSNQADLLTTRTANQVLLDLLTGALQLQQLSAYDEELELIENMRKWVIARVGMERTEVHDLTRRFAVSERGLYRLFARHQLTPDRWLWACRLEVAKHRLDLPFVNITQVALETGFKDVSHFSRLFSKMFGESPSVYRRKPKVSL